MPKQRIGLGRGLDALFPGAAIIPDETPLDTSLAHSALFEVPLDAITPNPYQPRIQQQGDAQLDELATSIKEFGLLQPLLLALDGEDEEGPRYRIIAGERRWRAAELAGLEAVPAVIREATPQLMLEMALVENLQRTDLNPLEEAQGYLMLMEEYGLTQEQVAERVGRNRATVANTVRLLQLPEEVREKLITIPTIFTEGHARAVLQVNGDAQRINLTNHIVAELMSVRRAEEEARRINGVALHLTPDRRGGQVRQQSYETRQLEEEFVRAVEMKVRLQRNNRGAGSLTFSFSNSDQLQVLYERIVGTVRSQLDGAGNGYSITAIEAPDGLLDDTFDISFDDADDHESAN